MYSDIHIHSFIQQISIDCLPINSAIINSSPKETPWDSVESQ